MAKFFEISIKNPHEPSRTIIIKTEKTSPLLDDENTKAIIKRMLGLNESDMPELEIVSIIKADPAAAKKAGKELTIMDKTDAGIEFYKKPT